MAILRPLMVLTLSSLALVRCGTTPAERGVSPGAPPASPPIDASSPPAADAGAAPPPGAFDAGGTEPDAMSPDASAAGRTSSIGRFVNAEALVDTDSFTPTDDELLEFARVANDLLVDRADVEIRLVGIRRVSYATVKASIDVDAVLGGATMSKVLQKVYEAATPPELLFFFHADQKSTSYGGYMIAFEKPGFCNRYKHPGTGKRTIVYGGAINWKHMFNRCGYERVDGGAPVRVSPTSIGGECQGRNGVTCELNADLGFYQCAPIDHANPYNAHRYSFVAATGVHELLHNFGANGNMDHFGTAKCDEMMGGTGYKDAGAYTFQRNAGICPSIFDRFVQSYEQCP